MRCILAIDSGGTKCDAMLVRDDGEVLSWARSDFGSGDGSSRLGSGRSRRAVISAMRTAMRGKDIDELHLACISGWLPVFPVPAGRLVKMELHPMLEHAAALALFGAEAGVVALAGTGAFVYACTHDGREFRLDGLGPLLGDYGGGYQIGLLAIRAAAKSGWHPRHATSLAAKVFERCDAYAGDRTGCSLINYMLQDHDRSEIAAFAKLVDEEANAGDRIARAILEEAADGIAETLFDVVAELGITDEALPLIGTGSICTRSEIYWERLCARVRDFAPRLRPMLSDMPAVAGVALGALVDVVPDRITSVRETLFHAITAYGTPTRVEERPAGYPIS